MHNIRVGQSHAALRFPRDCSGHTAVEVLEDGGLRICRLPLHDALTPGGVGRIEAAVRAALDPRRAITIAGGTGA